MRFPPRPGSWFDNAFHFGGGAPSAPAVPVLPPAAAPPTMASSAVASSAQSQRSTAAAIEGSGFAGTLTNTGGAQGQPGDLIPTTAGRSLLG